LCRYNLQQCDVTPRTPLGELTALPKTPDWILRRGKEGEKGGGKGKGKGEGERKGKKKQVKGKGG